MARAGCIPQNLDGPPLLQTARGVTLTEMAVVLAVIGILAAISVTGLHALKDRNNFSAAASMLAAAVAKVRVDSYGSGANTVFVLQPSTGSYWGVRDTNSDFNLASFSASNPAPSPDVLLFSGTLPTPVAVGPTNGYGAAMPAPFVAVPADTACTFCLPSGYGAVRFFASGGATFSGTNAANGSFSIQMPRNGGPGLDVRTFAILGRTGTLETFDGVR